MINNRQQQGRRRNRGGQRSGGRGPDNGNRIDNRARGNAPQLLEKYKTLARDAQQSGDRVMTEYYLQFADHYFRVVMESRARFEDRGGRGGEAGVEGQPYDADEFDADEGDDFFPPIRQTRPERQERGDRPERGERPDRGDRFERSERRERGERPERSERPERFERRDEPVTQNDQAGEEVAATRDEAPAPEVRRRRELPPRRDRSERTGGAGLDASVLPPSISNDVIGNDVGGSGELESSEPELPMAEATPRRRGRPRKDAVASATEE